MDHTHIFGTRAVTVEVRLQSHCAQLNSFVIANHALFVTFHAYTYGLVCAVGERSQKNFLAV